MNETLEVLLQYSRELGSTLWNAQSVAAAQAATKALGYSDGIDTYIRTHLMRAGFANEMRHVNLPDGWSVDVDTAHMCKVELHGPDCTVRYLKENRRIHPGGVPGAGRNSRRRAYWQEAFDDKILGICTPKNYLLLWSEIPSDESVYGFGLRLVHPTGVGRFGMRTPIDASVDLMPADGLESMLEFTGDDDEIDFFADIDMSLENPHAL